MPELIVAAVVITGVMLGVVLLNRSRKRRREALLTSRFSEQQREELREDFVIFRLLPEEMRERLEGLVHLFMAEKGFEPCGGIEEVTPRMQRLIAAQACLLIVGRPSAWYETLRTILVYPEAFTSEEGGARLGESWSSGSVVLSWASVVSGAENAEDGHDVSIHEFAHQLDQQNGVAVGLPELSSRGAYLHWGKVFSSSFEKFTKRVEKGKKTVIDRYGATNPAEFFAVATETFFEKPKQLEKRYPDLYQTLKAYYNLDPLHWKEKS